MKRLIYILGTVILVLAATHSSTFARGFGGFRGGGSGGFHGGGFNAGGFHGGGFDTGGFRAGGFDSGSFHAGGYEGGGMRTGGFDTSGFRAGGYDSGGVRAGQYGGGESLSRGALGGFLGLPTDGGMHAASDALGGRGMVAGSEGAAAWHGGATGHVYEGPMGTTVAHGSAGAVAGRGYASAYGTHTWSATYGHAQGLAAQRWVQGSHLFTPTWAASHAWAWHPAGYDAAAWATAAWRTAAWPAIGSWLGWNAVPAYYDYGDNITYASNYVYYGSQPAATPQQYYQEAANLASANADEQPASTSSATGNTAQWLPLGVFGLMGQDQTTPEMVFQLAVDKLGAIRGNYYDQITDTASPVVGAVNKRDQRAAWRIGTNKTLVIETGLYNLTLDHSTALVHYGPDRTQQFVLVRMKQPSEGPK